MTRAKGKRLRMAKSANIPTVDPNDMDLDNLKEHEARWLQDHGKLPEGYEPQHVYFYLPDGTKVANDPAVFNKAAEEVLASGEGFDAAVESRAYELAQELALKMVRDQHQNSVVAAGENHGNALNEPPAPPHEIVPTSDGVMNTSEDEDPGSPDVSGEDEGPMDYSDWTKAELLAELSNRGLDLEGNKAELLARLEENDTTVD